MRVRPMRVLLCAALLGFAVMAKADCRSICEDSYNRCVKICGDRDYNCQLDCNKKNDTCKERCK